MQSILFKIFFIFSTINCISGVPISDERKFEKNLTAEIVNVTSTETIPDFVEKYSLSPPSSTPSSASTHYNLVQLLILVLIFGTFFIIHNCSACIAKQCHCHGSTPADEAGNRNENGLRNVSTAVILSRFSKVPEPFGPDKQFCLKVGFFFEILDKLRVFKFDANGHCYASPLDSKDLLPLPSYEQACKLPSLAELKQQRELNESRNLVIFKA